MFMWNTFLYSMYQSKQKKEKTSHSTISVVYLSTLSYFLYFLMTFHICLVVPLNIDGMWKYLAQKKVLNTAHRIKSEWNCVHSCCQNTVIMITNEKVWKDVHKSEWKCVNNAHNNFIELSRNYYIEHSMNQKWSTLLKVKFCTNFKRVHFTSGLFCWCTVLHYVMLFFSSIFVFLLLNMDDQLSQIIFK